jgi:hypothetical protein
MSTDDRLTALRRTLPADMDTARRSVVMAALAGLEAAIAAKLALYVQGDPHALDDVARDPSGVAVVCAFAAAAEAINAAVGDDATRGYAALATLHERAAEYTAAHHEITGRPTGGNAP